MADRIWVYNFNSFGDNTIVLTTSDTPISGSEYQVTHISGFVNGSEITGLIDPTNANASPWFNDQSYFGGPISAGINNHLSSADSSTGYLSTSDGVGFITADGTSYGLQVSPEATDFSSGQFYPPAFIITAEGGPSNWSAGTYSGVSSPIFSGPQAFQNWNYTFANGYSFTITTSDTPDESGNYPVLAVSGTDNTGAALNLKLDSFFGADNLISNGPYSVGGVDYAGFSVINTDNISYNIWNSVNVGTVVLTSSLDIYSNSSMSNFSITNSFPVTCFLPGTLIRTTLGEVPVEELKIGDLVPTLTGEIVPVKWVGYQKFNGRFIPLEKSTVCFKAGSLGLSTPERDLYVTAAHAMVVNNTLVNAAQLVNGITITQTQSQDMVEVYHVDLGEHHCLLAEGTWAESYREAKNRHTFNNSQDYLALYPEASFETEQEACLPHVHALDDERLPSLVSTVLSHVPESAFSITPALHLIIDGVKVEATQSTQEAYSFLVPAGAKTIRLISHATSPLSIGESIDQRMLGFAVHELIYATLDGTSHYHVAPHSPILKEGFYEAEGEERRWTNGNALLPKSPLNEEALLTIKGRALARYLINPTPATNHEGQQQALSMWIVGG